MRCVSILVLLGCLSCVLSPQAPAPTAASAGPMADTLRAPVFLLPARTYPESRKALAEHRRACQAAFSAGQVDLDSVGRAFTRYF
ncbi:MAG: hypothetical protein IT260_06650 [Saprospiraceae bacterium]|nr:hypothetical protein [Saprospiraceae bacterium]